MNYYFITGTSKGLGKAIAEELLRKENNTVVGIARTNSLTHPHYNHHSIDLGDIDTLKRAIPSLFTDLADATAIVLINNAGLLGQVGRIGEISSESIEEVVRVNVTAPAILVNEFISRYRTYSCTKVIINVSSGAGKRPIDGWGAYCTSKAALDMLSMVAAQEEQLRKNNFRIFSVAPGIVDTTMQEQIRGADVKDFSRLQEFKDYKSKGMLARAEDVARKYIALAENAGKYNETVMSVKDIV
ncbi:MAG TPA: SDR family NAD(P)-dependent oxidoreductase [Candidatus Kapabacteria bacterium]|nr:SDR family NAD(P)-dependent oxidoreductase [Candidatus Kapabacteria bacterium]